MMAAALGAAAAPGHALSLPRCFGCQLESPHQGSNRVILRPGSAQRHSSWSLGHLHRLSADSAALQGSCWSMRMFMTVGVLIGCKRAPSRGSLTRHAQECILEDTRDVRIGPMCGDKLMATVKIVRSPGVFCYTTSSTEAFIPTSMLKDKLEMYEEGMQLEVTVIRPAMLASRKDEVLASDRDMRSLSELHVGTKVQGRVLKVSRTSLLLDIGFPMDAKCWRDCLPASLNKTVAVGDVLPGLKVRMVRKTSAEVVPEEFDTRPLNSFRIGGRIRGSAVRISPSLNAVFFDVGSNDNVVAFGRRGHLAKAIDEYVTGEQAELEVVEVAGPNKVRVKHLGR